MSFLFVYADDDIVGVTPILLHVNSLFENEPAPLFVFVYSR